MSQISLEALSKRYGEFRALTDFSLEVGSGEFVSLLGPSGSGKTTLLNLIAGTTRPTSGRILIDGVDVTDVPPSQRKLGMVFQNYALMPHMTVFENIAFPLQVRASAGPRSGAASARSSISSACPTSRVGGRRSCPAASSNGSPSRAASSTSRPSS